MKRAITLICLMIFWFGGLKSYSQTSWAPEGALWHYTYYVGGWSVITSYMTMTSVGDTIIEGNNCSVLNLVGPGDSIPWHNEFYYTYESNDTVYLYDGTQFRVLYNFNVNPGDSFESYGPQTIGLCFDDSTTMVVVDSVGIETVNGVSLKYIIVHTPEIDWGFQNCSWVEFYKIYQRIGSLGYMFPAKICGADGECVSDLRCYEDPQFGFYTTNVADSCTHEEGVGVKEIDYTDLIKLYPNPIIDHFSVEFKETPKDAALLIFSVEGRLIKQLSLTDKLTSIDFSDTKKGCYILRISLGKELYQERIIK